MSLDRTRCLLSLALILLSLPLGYAAHAQSGPFVAQATVYGTGDGGNCGYGTVVTGTIPFGRIVAVGGDDWNEGLACGRFIEIDTSAAICPGNVPCNFGVGPVIAQVVDQCPECADHHIDLSTLAWNAATNNEPPTLITNVTWDWLPGSYPGNMRLDIRPGSSAFFFSVIPRDFNVGVQTIEVRIAGESVWQPMPHEFNQGFFTWLAGGSALALPLSIRVTDQNGAVYVANDAVTSFTGSHDLGFQLAPPSPPPPSVPALIPVAALGLLGACVAVGRRRLRSRIEGPTDGPQDRR